MNRACKRRKLAYKEQGGVQVPDILGDHVIVVFVSNFLVGGPKVCIRVGLDLRRLQICNCSLEPEAEQS